MRSTQIHMRICKSLKGVDPSSIERKGCTLVYTGCVECLEDVDHFKESPHELYTCLEGQRGILEACRPFKDSPHGVDTILEGAR